MEDRIDLQSHRLSRIFFIAAGLVGCMSLLRQPIREVS